MSEYAVEITETLSRVITVEAESEDKALVTVINMYYSEEIVLDASDHVDTDFNIYED